MTDNEVNQDIMSLNVGDYVNISWRFSNDSEDKNSFLICRVTEKNFNSIQIEHLFSSDDRVKRFHHFKIDANFFESLNSSKSVLSTLKIVSFKKIVESEALSYGV